MKNLSKSASFALVLTSAAAVSFTTVAANAAVINLADFSATPPDGTTKIDVQNTNVKTLNGNASVLPASGTPVVYVVSTFTFGTSSLAHLDWRFYVNETSAPRLGIEVNNDGVVSIIGTVPVPTVDLAQNMAGQTITLLAKLAYDANNNVTYGHVNASDDTLMNVWINPDNSDVEGSGTSAGDMFTVWNSAGFNWFRQVIENQSTPGTAGDSSITKTVILTGTDATFANAMALVPEPTSLALLGLGGLLIAGRRRNA